MAAAALPHTKSLADSNNEKTVKRIHGDFCAMKIK
jgi:hypothetical protein